MSCFVIWPLIPNCPMMWVEFFLSDSTAQESLSVWFTYKENKVQNDEMAAGNEKKAWLKKCQPRPPPPFTIFPFPQKMSANSYMYLRESLDLKNRWFYNIRYIPYHILLGRPWSSVIFNLSIFSWKTKIISNKIGLSYYRWSGPLVRQWARKF